MKIYTAQRHVVMMLLVLLTYLLGCSAPSELTVSPATVRLSATMTPSPTAHASPTPSLEPFTVTPTLRPIHPTRTPSATPAPTLTAEEEHTLVFSMLRDNGGCQLPCWWGFTPGQTPWQTAETFFASWGQKAVRYRSAHSTNYTVFLNNQDQGYFHRQIYYEEEKKIVSIEVISGPTDGVGTTYGDPQFAEIWKPYMLPQILEVYGPPAQVFLGTGGAPWLPFDLLLFYPDSGFLIQYSGAAEDNGKTCYVCPDRVELKLYLYPRGFIRDLAEMSNIGGYTYTYGEMSMLHSLQEVTGMSIEQFYQVFVQPEHQTCLEAPSDLW